MNPLAPVKGAMGVTERDDVIKDGIRKSFPIIVFSTDRSDLKEE